MLVGWQAVWFYTHTPAGAFSTVIILTSEKRRVLTWCIPLFKGLRITVC